MPLRIDKFSGEIPKIIPRLLPNSSAQIAQNVRLEDGSLLPFRCGKLTHTFGTDVQSIYRHNGTWYGWNRIVKAAVAPVAEDRLYVTGDGRPRIVIGESGFDLRLRPPTGLITNTASGPLDPDTFSTVVYCYTYVTSIGEESPPSAVSNTARWNEGRNLTVTGFRAPPADRLINAIRIYRSQTSALGETSFFLVAERSSLDLSPFVDIFGENPIQEPLPSLDYDPPPDDLSGIIALPNGIMAGFVGKRLYFSEPFIPHAWPEKYILTTDFDIVGLGVFGQSVAIMTTGHPYVASGLTPDSMSLERLRVNHACVSARGIVDLGYAVIYPSNEGLVSISASGAQLVTGGLFSRETWQQLSPASIVAGHSNGRYVCTYDISGYKGLLIVDMSGEQPFLIRASDTAVAMWNEAGTGRLFMLQSGQRQVIEWDSLESPRAEQIWRSKLNVLPGHTNFGALLVEGVDTMTSAQRAVNRNRWNKDAMAASIEAMGSPPFWLEPEAEGFLNPASPPQPSFSALVYADGRPVHVVTDLNKPTRLPGGFLALSWEVEIRGTMQVTAISLAASPAELAQI